MIEHVLNTSEHQPDIHQNSTKKERNGLLQNLSFFVWAKPISYDKINGKIIKFLKEIFDNDDRYLDKILHNYIGKEDYNILKELFQK